MTYMLVRFDEVAYTHWFVTSKYHMHSNAWFLMIQLVLNIVVEFNVLLCVLVTTFCWQGFSDSVLGDSEIDDASIDWLCASMILMVPIWKLDEMWPSNYDVVFHEYPVWKFMKCGTWRKKEKVVAFCRSAPMY